MNTIYLAAAVVAELIFARSAGPPVAVVEAVSGNPADVEFMDYVEVGKVIHLNPKDGIVLSYMKIMRTRGDHRGRCYCRRRAQRSGVRQG
jgi:hypothetical protein